MPVCGYHLTAKAVSFGKGQSAVHTAAYNARSKPLEHEREAKQTNDYTRAGGLLFSGVFAPKGAPEWASDRQQLWNRAEAAERQWNGQPARNVIVAFPHQLDQQQREWMLKDFVREAYVRKGMVADVNMHAPHPGGDDRNYHAHILLTMRNLEGEGFAKTKNREWNKREMLEQSREKWAELGARMLERAGYEVEANRWRNGHKTLAEQREAAIQIGDREYAASLDREATKHKGPTVAGMERRGMETEVGNVYRDTLAQNAEAVILKAELVAVEKEIEAERKRASEEQRISTEQQRQALRQAAAETTEEKHGGRGGRWVAGPQTGGRVENEAWAMAEVKAKAARRNEEQARPKIEIDRDRMRTDPDYLKAVMKQRAAQRDAEHREARRAEEEEQRRKQDERARTKSKAGVSKQPEIDRERMKTDPEYLKAVMRQRAAQSDAERRASRAERGQEAQQDRDRQR